ncbi:FolC bifunctional protein [Aulographum hederae CBS 113979]|uniref:FolC bifunctional protein n=1 Tax=Aulographum hederae CBS 113979 TaxID=1176131 RepID=A0A6G1HD64_9PEZI|nr:FolC bifunctional protein [Aulographum hederae CBS 113979]
MAAALNRTAAQVNRTEETRGGVSRLRRTRLRWMPEAFAVCARHETLGRTGRLDLRETHRVASNEEGDCGCAKNVDEGNTATPSATRSWSEAESSAAAPGRYSQSSKRRATVTIPLLSSSSTTRHGRIGPSLDVPVMIELGLSRITSLVAQKTFPWKAIHVAGTNGKGSICTYISAMLHRGGVRTGRFNSPHFLDRWDCITIDEKPVTESVFRSVEAKVLARNEKEKIGATEFEVLTATAFNIFTQEKVDVGVVEVGMGGRLDATNILEAPLVTVISKIGMDHQAFLGDTLEKIAAEKAGILKPGVPAVVDGTNSPSVIKVIKNTAHRVSAGRIYTSVKLDLSRTTPNVRPSTKALARWKAFAKTQMGVKHRRINMAVASKAVSVVWPLCAPPGSSLHPHDLVPAIMTARVPGRCEEISITPLTGRKGNILIDGAHNPEGVNSLNMWMESHCRIPAHDIQNRTTDGMVSKMDGKITVYEQSDVTWVVALSAGKNISDMLRDLVQPEDRVIAVEFGPVDGMPWVKPTPAEDIAAVVRDLQLVSEENVIACGKDVLGALKRATQLAGDMPIVVMGSLYLVSDVFRLLREKGSDGSPLAPSANPKRGKRED